jgi:uncharacterized Zn-binding protein involved in type VI secretion
MGNTVYAEGMGYFHKGSSGKGIAPGDVCLSPPPPPTGPAPVPYVNVLQASNLAKGSKTVKIQGNPTALENASHISTSTGDEPGTQGGGVVTHKTKGKGSFKLWSFVVKAQGKGVARHGDPMEQNTASPLPNCIDAAALVNFAIMMIMQGNFKPCGDKKYNKKCRPSRKAAQRDEVNGNPCWECKMEGKSDADSFYLGADGSKLQKTRVDDGSFEQKEYMTHDHQPPLVVAWYMGGCHMGRDKFKEHFSKPETVKPHCKAHATSQGSKAKKYAKKWM